jgi:hypothetical protein
MGGGGYTGMSGGMNMSATNPFGDMHSSWFIPQTLALAYREEGEKLKRRQGEEFESVQQQRQAQQPHEQHAYVTFYSGGFLFVLRCGSSGCMFFFCCVGNISIRRVKEMGMAAAAAAR